MAAPSKTFFTAFTAAILFACGGEAIVDIDEGDEVAVVDEALTGLQSDAVLCSHSSSTPFSRVTDCRNATLPPAPSIRRSFVRPRKNFSQDATVRDGSMTKAYSARAHAGGYTQTVVLPTHRTTVDGRLATVGVGLSRFNPENIDSGFQTHADPTRRVMGTEAGFFYYFRVDPRPGKSRIPQNIVTHPNALRTGIFWEVCNGTSSPEGETQMRRCQARRSAQSPLLDGECYDLSVIWGNYSDYHFGVDTHWELRSLAITVFAPKEKSVPSPSQAPWQDERVWYYPRQDVEGLSVLPPYDDYAYPAPANPNYSYAEYVDVVKNHCGPNSTMRFCNYLNQQKFLAPSEPFRMYTGPHAAHLWFGKQGNTKQTFHGFLEPASTADGRVMFIHDYGQGIMYSYNSVAACDASGFREFKPITQAYLDSNVNKRYGFAKFPVRDTHGKPMAPGSTVAGAYPWVDRKGNNLLFPIGVGQDGWRGTWVKNPDEASWKHDLTEVKSHQVNQMNAVGVVALGSWTRGKMVLLDNGLNATDWSFSPFEDDLINHRFRVPLYQNEQVLIRPAGTSVLNSLENAFNQYNALNPISPFDVVWVASSSQERNAEIVFDEYLRKGARVVAHMNAPIKDFTTGRPEFPFFSTFDNGFVPTALDKEFKFRKTPKLQNASTMENPATLELRGGAFIPPIAEGGVVGRGVFLDGLNDHILVQRLPGLPNHFYLGIFVDLRATDVTEFRTLYRFGDGFRVLVRPGAVQFVSASGERQTQSLNVKATSNGRYFHLGLTFDVTSQATTIKTFLDGTPVGQSFMTGMTRFAVINTSPMNNIYCPQSSQVGWVCQANNLGAALCQNGKPITTTHCGFSGSVCSPESIASSGPPCVSQGTLVVGSDRLQAGKPIRAWVDEFRLFDLKAGESDTSTFAELACNEALGSLSGNTVPFCEQIAFRSSETQDFEGVGTGLDFPVEAYTRLNCGSVVHRDNPGRACGRNEALGLSNKQIVAHLPRPDFSSVAFCRSCHADNIDVIEGLRVNKLTAGTMAAKEDARRQPMSWFRIMPGRAPVLDGTALAPWGPSWDSGLLDEVHYGPDAQTAPRRAGPYKSASLLE